MKTRMILGALALLLLLCLPLPAEEAGNFVAVGASLNQYTTPMVNGNFLYGRQLDASANLYSFTFVDIISRTAEDKFTTATTVSTGIAQRIFTLDKVRAFATTGVGVLYGENNVGYSWTMGLATYVPMKAHVFLLPNVRILKSSLTDFQWVGGVMLGFK